MTVGTINGGLGKFRDARVRGLFPRISGNEKAGSSFGLLVADVDNVDGNNGNPFGCDARN